MGNRVKDAMWAQLFERSGGESGSLQGRIRSTLVAAILGRQLPAGQPLLSSRALAAKLGVARNTVVLSYQQLVDEGYLLSVERRGFFVNPAILSGHARPPLPDEVRHTSELDWADRFRVRASAQRKIEKPRDWQDYSYPFVYGQFDPQLFPVADWRECSRMALSVLEIRGWASDLIDRDDPMLIEQLQLRVLSPRGVWARPEEIMVTIGAQQALYLLAELLVRADTIVGIEDPGYSDARNIFAAKNARLHALPLDANGLIVGPHLARCDYLYVTPSYQCPTTVTMPIERRIALLEQAVRDNLVLIEDDYEPEASFGAGPTPALKSLDAAGRVLYVGSLSKTLAPGLRLGFLVGPAELMREARALRRLMLRHPPVNNQRAAALFLSLGHHNALLRRLHHAIRQRAEVLTAALAAHLPECRSMRVQGGSSIWLEGPAWLDARVLAACARKRGVLIEPGHAFFLSERPPLNYFRLGFSSIAVDRIEAGVRELALALRELVP
jgi:GntR family transcriptional regulator/MocR family aminotransferase